MSCLLVDFVDQWAGPSGPGEGQTSLPDEPDKTSLDKQYAEYADIFSCGSSTGNGSVTK